MAPIQLSPHFSLEEMIRTKVDLPNQPGDRELSNLQLLCVKVLEPLRLKLRRPIRVTSGYRSPDVNKAVGGVPSSHHVIGCAADLVVDDLSPDDVVAALRSIPGIRWTQLIREPSWVHVSYVVGNLKCETLRAIGTQEKGYTYTKL